MLKIAVIGPESTGKTTLCEQLANYYGVSYVPEYARDYLLENGLDYTFEDVLKMAKGQMLLEDNHHADLQLLDTNLYVYKVWIDVKYQKSIPWIEQELKQRHYDHYLLCHIDLPWEADPMREYPNPDDRKHLFDMYHALLQSDGTPYTIIEGNSDERMKKSIAAIESIKKFV
jgi:NadR type nicotinamide-nucleotide adenylyltransferase